MINVMQHKMLLINIFLLFIILASVTGELKPLENSPPWLIKCQRNDPEINSCILKLFNHLFPYMAKGIPEIDMPRFEPFFIERISLSKGHGPVTISGSFTNIIVNGPSQAVTESTSIDVNKNYFDFTIALPELRIKAHYNLKGHILVLPLVGDGDALLRFHNATSIIKNVYELQQINGKEILQIKEMNVDFRINKTDIHLDNLFNGNKVLGQTLNNFLNKNAEEVVNELRDSISGNLKTIFKSIFNKSFKLIPTELWFSQD